MKRFILITLIALVQLKVCQSATFLKDGKETYSLDEDYGDDADLFSPDEEDDKEDESPKPIYDIKDAPNLFKKFIKDYEKKYKDTEDQEKHYKTFVENLKEINRINSDKEYSTTVDINLFTDFSRDERQLLLGIPT